MFGGGARNAGVTAADGPRDPEVVWRFETPTRMTTDPVVGDGAVVVGTIGDSPTSRADGEDFSDPALYGVSAADGSERFRFDLPSSPHGTPAIHDGHVFVETEDDGIYALDATDGGFAWSRSTDATFRAGDVTVSGGTVYLAVDRGVVGRDAATGGVRTRIDIDRALSKAFAIADGVLYVARDRDDGGSDRSGGLDAVTLDGERLWRVESGFPTGGPAVGDGTVVWTTATAAHAHDATTGEERWQFEPARGTGSPAIADGVAYLGSRGTSFHALEVASGEPAWSVETTSRPSVAPVVAGSAVYYGSGAHRVYARDTATGEKLWYRQIGWLPSDPALAGGTVFVTGKTELVALRDS
jgi:outer membrane protein assembly factor BamB